MNANRESGRFRTLPLNVAIGLVFNTAIGIGLTVARDVPFGPCLVYSQCIGLSILLLVDGTRRFIWGANPPAMAGLVGLAAIGIVAGFVIGNAAAGLLLGRPVGPALHATFHDKAIVAVTIFAGVGGTWYFLNRERVARLKLQTETLERTALEARLKLLQTQIEPHFLFNTLANLHTLITADPARARRMLEHLDEYLRTTLTAARRDSGTLGDEFALLRGYLELMVIRMGPRLAYSLNLPPELAAAKVPPMLLQPLVENAVKHGLEPKTDGGRIDLNARDEADSLVVTIRDTGLGISATTNGNGVGLQHVRDRLEAAYGERGGVTIERPESGGTLVTVRLPFET